MAVPQQQQGLGTPGSLPAAAAAARQLDPQVQAPGPSHTPVSMPAAPRGTGLAKPAISWASVVQVNSELLLRSQGVRCGVHAIQHQRGEQVAA